MLRRWLILTTLGFAITGAAAVVARDVLFGPADLNRVRADVIPRLAGELASAGFELGQPIFIRIFKASRELEVWMMKGGSYSLFKTYEICAHSGELGPKLKEGDRQSPEGFYFVTPEQMNPNSRYHLSFNLGFPNAYDRAHARTGSFLMVHGNCLSIGCYAMTDAGIEEIYLLAESAFANGQPFFRTHIFPFRMTDGNLATHAGSHWIEFWRNLKDGYDWFEDRKVPPAVFVKGGLYTFDKNT